MTEPRAFARSVALVFIASFLIPFTQQIVTPAQSQQQQQQEQERQRQEQIREQEQERQRQEQIREQEQERQRQEQIREQEQERQRSQQEQQNQISPNAVANRNNGSYVSKSNTSATNSTSHGNVSGSSAKQSSVRTSPATTTYKPGVSPNGSPANSSASVTTYTPHSKGSSNEEREAGVEKLSSGTTSSDGVTTYTPHARTAGRPNVDTEDAIENSATGTNGTAIVTTYTPRARPVEPAIGTRTTGCPQLTGNNACSACQKSGVGSWLCKSPPPAQTSVGNNPVGPKQNPLPTRIPNSSGNGGSQSVSVGSVPTSSGNPNSSSVGQPLGTSGVSNSPGNGSGVSKPPLPAAVPYGASNAGSQSASTGIGPASSGNQNSNPTAQQSSISNVSSGQASPLCAPGDGIAGNNCSGATQASSAGSSAAQMNGSALCPTSQCYEQVWQTGHTAQQATVPPVGYTSGCSAIDTGNCGTAQGPSMVPLPTNSSEGDSPVNAQSAGALDDEGLSTASASSSGAPNGSGESYSGSPLSQQEGESVGPAPGPDNDSWADPLSNSQGATNASPSTSSGNEGNGTELVSKQIYADVLDAGIANGGQTSQTIVQTFDNLQGWANLTSSDTNTQIEGVGSIMNGANESFNTNVASKVVSTQMMGAVVPEYQQVGNVIGTLDSAVNGNASPSDVDATVENLGPILLQGATPAIVNTAQQEVQYFQQGAQSFVNSGIQYLKGIISGKTKCTGFEADSTTCYQ
jgi:hypothetical protein